jgi:hypothetical protein
VSGPPKEKAPTLTVEAQESAHPLYLMAPTDSEARNSIAQSEKSIATARAKLALVGGYQLHIIDAGHGRPAFLVSKWNLTRELADLDAVHAFIRQVGGDA